MNRSSPVAMMLQFAFGPGPGSASAVDGPAAHANGTGVREAAPQLLALATAARAWWEAGRPKGWFLEQHLADPTAGHDDTAQEHALAEAVAHWVRQGC